MRAEGGSGRSRHLPGQAGFRLDDRRAPRRTRASLLLAAFRRTPWAFPGGNRRSCVEIQQDLGNAVEAGPDRLYGTGSYRECAWIRSARLKPGMLEKEGFAALVLRLRAEGISDLDLLTAVEQTPRSLFVPPMLSEEAYSSRTVPIDCGSFMEGADLAVRLLHRLQVKPG